MGGGPIVVAHDYLTQRGGAERVVLRLLDAFPGSRTVAGMYDPAGTYPEFMDRHITTLWPDRFPPFRTDPRRALPVLAPAFARHEITDAAAVICSSSGWAHGIGGSAPKIVYCHNTPRWLYQHHEYLSRLPASLRQVFHRAAAPLVQWDARAAGRAHTYIANSSVVAGRIRAAYGRDPVVVAPPRGLDPDGEQEPVPGLEPGFLLTIGRPRGYKNTRVVCEAVEGLPHERLVAVGGLPHGQWSHRLQGLTSLRDEHLRWLYANCAALVAVAEEDFGLTPVEAQAFGRPSVVLRKGGYLDSTAEGLTGVFVAAAHRELVRDGIREALSTTWDARAIREHGELFSPERFGARMRAIVNAVVAGHELDGSLPLPRAGIDLTDGALLPSAH